LKPKVCIIGLGYIGLPTAAMFARQGVQVVGVDISQRAIDTINAGKAHIIEPDLDEAVKSAVVSGLLRAQRQPEAAEYFILCVPTPFHEKPGVPEPNIDYVLAAAESIAPHLQPGNTVIVESTSPVGTTEAVQAKIRGLVGDEMVLHFVYCPERVLPGKILTELVENDRIVGGLTPEATDRAAELYSAFVKGTIHKTNAKTAEMSKLVENSFRDVSVAFANELSILCDNVGVDVWELIRMANKHPRVNILQPGCGVGGHCIAVDPWFLVSMDEANAQLVHTARKVNDHKPRWVVGKVLEAVEAFRAREDREPTVACLGLAFKPNVDDFRESPALWIAANLIAKGVKAKGVEPYVHEGAQPGVPLMELDNAVANADILVGLVMHDAFRGLGARRSDIMDFCGILQS
jgi:UDP-N-acetyl-D-mannosaminuronic acid dehydrogenase